MMSRASRLQPGRWYLLPKHHHGAHEQLPLGIRNAGNSQSVPAPQAVSMSPCVRADGAQAGRGGAGCTSGRCERAVSAVPCASPAAPPPSAPRTPPPARPARPACMRQGEAEHEA
eukprot:COSAG01_NODE_715_length_14093_cov_64.209233_2_plen_115_part_00